MDCCSHRFFECSDNDISGFFFQKNSVHLLFKIITIQLILIDKRDHQPVYQQWFIKFSQVVCQRKPVSAGFRSEEHTSELQSRGHLVCRLLLEKKKKEKD